MFLKPCKESQYKTVFRVINLVIMRLPSLAVRLVSALTPTIGMGPIGLQGLISRDVKKVNHGVAELEICIF